MAWYDQVVHPDCPSEPQLTTAGPNVATCAGTHPEPLQAENRNHGVRCSSRERALHAPYPEPCSEHTLGLPVPGGDADVAPESPVDELSEKHKGLRGSYVGIRGTATNHIAGDGWWAWWIALKGGDTSIGVVVDQDRADWPEESAPVGEKLRAFLAEHVAAREMMAGAEFVAGDVHFRRNLPYFSKVQAGDGFVLTGDASAFLDPLYSPGMDWISFTTLAAVRLVKAWRNGEDLEPLLEKHNKDFTTSYTRMFEALYERKYDYLGDYDLMRIAFRLDIALYYLFVVRPVFSEGEEGFVEPPYAAREAWPIFHLMRAYNRRFASIARRRREDGTFGRNNALHRDLFPGFNFRVPYLLKVISGALAGWAWLELREGWRSWGAGERTAIAEADAPLAADAQLAHAATR